MSVVEHDTRPPATFFGDGELPYGIKHREAEIMHKLLLQEKPEATAEIGCANGGSTLVIANALETNGRGHHHAVDPMQVTAWKDAGKSRIADANLDHRVTFHDMYPEEAFPTLPRLDFVFIDGSHLFDLTILDFVLADKRLRRGGIIAFHDTCLPAIRKVLHFVLANRAYEPMRLTSRPLTRRWSIWKTVRCKTAAAIAKVISGEPDMVPQSKSFKQLGLDRSNLVYIRKMHDDNRHSRYFVGF